MQEVRKQIKSQTPLHSSFKEEDFIVISILCNQSFNCNSIVKKMKVFMISD